MFKLVRSRTARSLTYLSLLLRGASTSTGANGLCNKLPMNVLVLHSDANDSSNRRLYDAFDKVNVLGTVDSEDHHLLSSDGAGGADESGEEHTPHCIFACWTNAKILSLTIKKYPKCKWIHCRSAGIDHVVCEDLKKWESNGGIVTNSKGIFNKSLTEWVIFSCIYFSRNVPRLLRNQSNKNWDRYEIDELTSKTMGVVGFGSIGRQSGVLAKQMGMKVIGYKSKVGKLDNVDDHGNAVADKIYTPAEANALRSVMEKSDFILLALPATPGTDNLINKETLKYCKKDAVIINVGRGNCVDEGDLINALKNGDIKGASLDVFKTEPLDEKSELWSMGDKVLLSPHNMDMTKHFMKDATDFFCDRMVEEWVNDDVKSNKVSVNDGY